MSTRYVLAIRTAAVPNRAIEHIAAHAGLHPALVARLIELGAFPVEVWGPAQEEEAVRRVTRLVRLRHDLGISFSGAILASELLERIDALEATLANAHPDSER